VRKRVYISTAERSGALYAGLISQELKKAGAQIIWPSSLEEGNAPVGFAAGIEGAGEALVRMKRIEREVRRVKPDVFLAVAWSEPNTILGLRLKDMKGMRRVFFAPPQLWAWGRFRATLLRKGYDALLCLYPREALFLRSIRLPAHFAGNPLVEHLTPYFDVKRKTSRASRSIALLAGSRPSEQSRHKTLLKGFRDAWKQLYPKDRAIWLFLTEGEAKDASFLLEGYDKATGGSTRYRALASADLAVVASGTACLETALLGIPQVVFYSLPRLEVALIRMLARVKHFALPNVIIAEDAVPELLNPSVGDLVEKAKSTICKSKEARELAIKLRKKLSTPLDNFKTLLSILQQATSREAL